MNSQGCVSTTEPNEWFSESFLSNPLFDILPDGIDVCYDLLVQPDVIGITLYVYDSTSPLQILHKDLIFARLDMIFKPPRKWSSEWTPVFHNVGHIPSLNVNPDVNSFNFQGATLGTFLLFCGSLYAQSLNLHYLLLEDASDGYRLEANIYTKLGFRYVDSKDSRMIANVNHIVQKIPMYIEKKAYRLQSKLDEYDQIHRDEEWTP